MNITKYFREHEVKIKQEISETRGKKGFKKIMEIHKRYINFIQHERLIHLLVTLAFAVLLMFCLVISVIQPGFWVLLMILLIISLLIPYIFHYFYLENTAQRWYSLMDELENKIK